MDKIYLSLALHNHQPVGNFDFVIEDAFQKAYEPMIAALEQHPGVRLAMHYSGPLRDWLKACKPDFLRRLRTLVGRKQIEIMTGGYYEPILVALPDADKLGQINKLTEAIRADFGAEPIGAWLAERVWEPHLPKALHEAGVEYTIVDDTHFKYAGYTDDDLFGYYVTEEQGHPLKVFGTSKHLRYSTPWTPVPELIEWLRQQMERPVKLGAPLRVAVMGDDGEKFGSWPTTYDHCWTGGWVDAFFTALEQNAEWLITCPPGEMLKRLPPLGRVYLPTAAYDEMTEWSLPAQLENDLSALKKRLQKDKQEDVLRFIKGGFWRSFMVKYPEVNTLHKRMLWTSDSVHRMKKAAARNAALDHLWAAQCNCPYWHGVFGGVYLFHIREANYRHLIEAQTAADRLAYATAEWIDLEAADIDRDGRDEAIVSTESQWLMFDPPIGGALIEWDWRARGLNVINTMTRWREGYHQDLIDAAARNAVIVAGRPTKLENIHSGPVKAKEPGLEKKLIVDWYRRASLIDHVFAPDETLEAFYRTTYREWGDFVDQPYQMKVARSAKKITLTLARDGGVWIDDTQHPLHVEKKIVVESGQPGFIVTYTLINTGEEKLAVRFGVETNWGFSGGNVAEGAYVLYAGGVLHRLNAIEATAAAKDAAVVIEHIGRGLLRLSEAADWWQFPLETVSLSEAGFERGYQGTTLMAHWPLDLEPGAMWKMKMQLNLVQSA
jgi:alpha-amylase